MKLKGQFSGKAGLHFIEVDIATFEATGITQTIIIRPDSEGGGFTLQPAPFVLESVLADLNFSPALQKPVRFYSSADDNALVVETKTGYRSLIRLRNKIADGDWVIVTSLRRLFDVHQPISLEEAVIMRGTALLAYLLHNPEFRAKLRQRRD